MTVVEFEVEGTPRPQGSKTAVRHGNKARLINAGTNGPTGSRKAFADWRAAVTAEAAAVAAEVGCFDGPINVRLSFQFLAPRARAAKLAKGDGIAPHTVKPDADKLARAVLDSLTAARLIKDDARICVLRVTKDEVVEPWTPGVHIEISGKAS